MMLTYFQRCFLGITLEIMFFVSMYLIMKNIKSEYHGSFRITNWGLVQGIFGKIVKLIKNL